LSQPLFAQDATAITAAAITPMSGADLSPQTEPATACYCQHYRDGADYHDGSVMLLQAHDDITFSTTVILQLILGLEFPISSIPQTEHLRNRLAFSNFVGRPSWSVSQLSHKMKSILRLSVKAGFPFTAGRSILEFIWSSVGFKTQV
jgi:hypothetical protein